MREVTEDDINEAADDFWISAKETEKLPMGSTARALAFAKAQKKEARLKELHSQIKEKREDLFIVQDLLNCGMDVTSNATVSGRSGTHERFTAAVNQGTLGRISSGDRLRIMAKHGTRALKIVVDNQKEVSPMSDTMQLLMDSREYNVERLFEDFRMENPEARKDVRDTVYAMLLRSAMWVAAGKNQFTLSHNLAAALMLTDVPKIDPDELKFPYKSIVFTLPPNIVPFFVDPQSEGAPEWADMVWVFLHDDTIRWVVQWRTFMISRLTSLDLSIIQEERLDPVAGEDQITLDAATRLVQNFLLWLNADGGMAKQKPVQVAPKLAEKRKRGGEVWPKQWEFGRTVVLGPELRRAAAEVALGRSKRHAVEGWTLRTRFTVRGHWRNQAHGEGRALRRRQWIAPFWKGPPEAEAWGHIYKDKV